MAISLGHYEKAKRTNYGSRRIVKYQDKGKEPTFQSFIKENSLI